MHLETKDPLRNLGNNFCLVGLTRLISNHKGNICGVLSPKLTTLGHELG